MLKSSIKTSRRTRTSPASAVHTHRIQTDALDRNLPLTSLCSDDCIRSSISKTITVCVTLVQSQSRYDVCLLTELFGWQIFEAKPPKSPVRWKSLRLLSFLIFVLRCFYLQIKHIWLWLCMHVRFKWGELTWIQMKQISDRYVYASTCARVRPRMSPGSILLPLNPFSVISNCKSLNLRLLRIYLPG